MIYLYENLAEYSDESYLKHLNSLPAWRKEKALQYKKLDDRKRSVLAFVLLQRALREEYGITEVLEFVYPFQLEPLQGCRCLRCVRSQYRHRRGNHRAV